MSTWPTIAMLPTPEFPREAKIGASQLGAASERAIEDWQTRGNRLSLTGYANPYIDSSNCSDVYTITTWALYHTGRAPLKMIKSRGYTWRIDLVGECNMRVEVKNPRDHRNGVERK
jgi:hypothetical protein